jgi:hypothetical protein
MLCWPAIQNLTRAINNAPDGGAEKLKRELTMTQSAMLDLSD